MNVQTRAEIPMIELYLTPRMWDASYHFFFFFYFYYENLIFNILKTIDTSLYKISIQLICIVFTPGINLSAPCKRIVEAPRACYSRMLFFLTRAQKL